MNRSMENTLNRDSWHALRPLFLAIVLVVVLAWAALAKAATIPLKITITPPTTGCTVGITPCNNAPLTGTDALTGAEVYLSKSPIPNVAPSPATLVLAAGVYAAQYSMSAENGETIYMRTRVQNSSGFSALGKELTYPVKIGVIPNPPPATTLTTAETVAYQLNLGTNNKIYFSRIGTIELRKACIPGMTAMDKNVLQSRDWVKMDANKTLPRQAFVRCVAT